MLAVLVVGLLRSHAVIVRALHDAGVNLDPDLTPGTDRSVPAAIDLRPSTEIYSDSPPDIRTVPGVPEPADISGQRAADISGQTPMGGTRAITVHGRPGATLLAFLTTGCTTCAGFWNSFADGISLPADTRMVIVTKGGDAESPADVSALAPPGIVTISSTEAWEDYRVPVAPYFVLVDGPSGVIVGEGAAHSWDLVLQLLARAMADAGYSRAPMSRRENCWAGIVHDGSMSI